MTDEQFDDLARGALDFQAGEPSESTWNKVKGEVQKPARWSWLPTIPEILVSGAACAAVLLLVTSLYKPQRSGVVAQNPVIQKAMDESPTAVLTSATLVAMPQTSRPTNPGLRGAGIWTGSLD